MSYQQIANETLATLERQGRTVDAATRQRIQTPTGLLELMRESAQRYEVAARDFKSRAERGGITQSDLDLMRSGLDSLYNSQMSLYRLFQANIAAELLAVAGIEPPVREFIAAPAGSGLRGLGVVPVAVGAALGAEALAAAGTMLSWIGGVVAAVLGSQAFLVVFGVVAVSGVIIYVVNTSADTQRIADHNTALTATFDRCLQAGGTIEQCTQSAEALHPKPPLTSDGPGPFDRLFDLAKIAVGVGAIGIGAYFAINLVNATRGGGGGGGSPVIIINPDDRGGSRSQTRQTSRAESSSLTSPAVVIGGLLVAAVGYLWWSARGTTPPAAAATPATGTTGNLNNQLFGRGAYGNSASDMPQRVSFEQFTSKRGPSYDLEVGR